MDTCEKLVIQQYFSYLVKEGKADELLDELISKFAIDLDDYQRVFKGQVTDSDKMRELLRILLRKPQQKDGKVFQSLLNAFRKTKRGDIAQALMKFYNSTNSTQRKTPVPGNTSGFCFTPGTASTSMRQDNNVSCNTDGMDVADSISNHSGNMDVADSISNHSGNNQTQTTTGSIVKDDLTNHPVPITAEQVKKAVSLNQHGSSGKLSVGGHMFTFKRSGQYMNGTLKWNMKVTEDATGRVVEKLSDDGCSEILESCLLEFMVV